MPRCIVIHHPLVSSMKHLALRVVRGFPGPCPVSSRWPRLSCRSAHQWQKRAPRMALWHQLAICCEIMEGLHFPDDLNTILPHPDWPPGHVPHLLDGLVPMHHLHQETNTNLRWRAALPNASPPTDHHCAESKAAMREMSHVKSPALRLTRPSSRRPPR